MKKKNTAIIGHFGGEKKNNRRNVLSLNINYWFANKLNFLKKSKIGNNKKKQSEADVMKALMVLDNLSVDSGVSSIVLNLCNHINLVNFDFLIFKNTGNNYIRLVEEKGSKVFVLPNPLSIKNFFEAKRSLQQFFETNGKEYDVVHLHSPSLNEFILKKIKTLWCKK
jgi:hypothetical protein